MATDSGLKTTGSANSITDEISQNAEDAAWPCASCGFINGAVFSTCRECREQRAYAPAHVDAERLQTLIDYVPTWVPGKWDRRDILSALRELQQLRITATAAQQQLEHAEKHREQNRETAFRLQQSLTASESRITELENGMQHIAEYWNGHDNDSAVFDAITHVSEFASEIIAKGKT